MKISHMKWVTSLLTGHIVYIQGRHDKSVRKEVTPCLGEVLDSRVVVGLGERTLLPGHVRETGTSPRQGLASSIFFLYTLLYIIFK